MAAEERANYLESNYVVGALLTREINVAELASAQRLADVEVR